MPFPFDDHVWRCVMNWSDSAGNTAANVMYFNDLTNARGAAAMASSIDTTFTANEVAFSSISASWTALTMDLTPMDGFSAPLNFPFTATLDGSATGDPIMEASMIVTLQSTQIGRRRRGRVFLGPIGEGAQDSGVFSDAQVSTVQDAWDQNLADFISDDIQPVIASQAGSGAFTAVERYLVRKYVGTQRRRLVRTRG